MGGQFDHRAFCSDLISKVYAIYVQKTSLEYHRYEAQVGGLALATVVVCSIQLIFLWVDSDITWVCLYRWSVGFHSSRMAKMPSNWRRSRYRKLSKVILRVGI